MKLKNHNLKKNLKNDLIKKDIKKSPITI